LQTSNLILDFEFDQHLESHKHVISIIMGFRDTGCYKGDQWNPQKGRVGRVLWLFWGFLCGSPSLCRLRTEGLVPVSKYWTYRSHVGDMGLISLLVHRWQVFGLSALLQWLCWERNWGGSRRPLSRAERWSREHFFSGVVHLSNPVDDSQKVDTYGDRP
jgi:hypothetical protein